jgi:RNA 3'-terminal phosphate cyclase
MAPPVGYLQHVFLPTLLRLTGIDAQVGLCCPAAPAPTCCTAHRRRSRRVHGLLTQRLQVDLVRRGFFPRGGGIVRVRAAALAARAALPCWDLTERGQVQQVEVWAFGAGKVPEHVAGRMAAAAQADLRAGLPEGGQGVAFVQQVRCRAGGGGAGAETPCCHATGALSLPWLPACSLVARTFGLPGQRGCQLQCKRSYAHWDAGTLGR